MIRGNDGRLTVIDFDDAGYSWYLYDYASSLSFIEHEPYAPDLAKAWVKGYQRVAGSFTDEELRIMSALSMIRRMQMLETRQSKKSNRKHVKIRNHENLNFYNLTTSDRNQPNEESMA